MAHSGAMLKRHGYTQLKKIGEGSFGQALLVEAESGAKLVCKMINVSQASAKEVQDTRKEAQLLAAFKHPFIVEYCANFIDGGWLCILMAFCEGGDLTSQVDIARKARRYIQESQVLRWMTQALLALKYIHDRHVLHRDLKSGNFFLSKAGNLKMGDFGIAKVLTSTQAVARTQIGTPYYLSPEVCQDKPYAWASDIWAMGIIMFELCALKLPFDGGSNMIVLVQAIVRGTTPSLPEEYSEFSRQLCHELLSKNPAQRPSAGAVLSRPQFQRIVQQFFNEAKAKAAQEQQGPTSGVEAASVEAKAAYQLGDLVEYYSNTHKAWVPAVVTGVDGSRVVLDVKPNTWMTAEQQAQQLRRRDAAEAPRPQLNSEACSTQMLEQMLEQVQGEGVAQPTRAPATEAPTVLTEEPESEERGAAPSRESVGIGGPSLDEECATLLEELGLEKSAAPGQGPASPASPAGGELSQAELDVLNDSLLNGV